MKHGTTAVIAAILLAAAGCEKKGACGGDVSVDISGNHGHTVNVPADGVRRGIGGTYPLKGAEHEHVINLKDADLVALNEGQPVTTRATSVNGHTHEVRLHCAQ